jgi:hypothetical protein
LFKMKMRILPHMGNCQIENITTNKSSIERSGQKWACTSWSDTSRSWKSSWAT